MKISYSISIHQKIGSFRVLMDYIIVVLINASTRYVL